MNVEVKESGIEAAGRGLFSKTDFAPGDVVLALDRPYVAELDTERLLDTCAWCFKSEPSNSGQAPANVVSSGDIEVKACTGCKRVKYCSRSCQSKAWKREHKYECKALAPENRPDLPHAVRAVIKLLGKLKNDPETKDELLVEILQFSPAGGSAGFAALDVFKQRKPEQFNDFSMLAYAAWKYADEPKLNSLDSEMIAKAFFFDVMSNTFQLSNPLDDVCLGMGFDPIVCSANHSCTPNVDCLFNQPSILLRALKPIQKGEEIFMNYVDVTNPFSVRHSELSDSYLFSCRCPKCVKGAVFPQDTFLKPIEQLTPEFVELADSLIKRHEKQLPTFHVLANDELNQRRMAALQAEVFSVSGLTFDVNKGNASSSEAEILDALKICFNSGMWSYNRQPVPHLLRQLFVMYMAEARMYQAWRVGIVKRFLVNPTLYPQPFHRQRVIDSWALASATNFLCNLTIPESKAIFDECMVGGLDLRLVYFAFLFETRENLGKSYGRDSPFGRLVEAIYQQVIQNTEPSLVKIKGQIEEIWPKLDAIARSVDVLKLAG